MKDRPAPGISGQVSQSGLTLMKDRPAPGISGQVSQSVSQSVSVSEQVSRVLLYGNVGQLQFTA